MPKKKILVAEDDEMLSVAYTTILTQSGYDILVARDGQKAIDLIKKKKPPVALLDLRMPIKNGFEVLKELNKSGLTKKVSIIVCSNHDTKQDIEKCLKLGAKKHLLKANTPLTEIVSIIEAYS